MYHRLFRLSHRYLAWLAFVLLNGTMSSATAALAHSVTDSDTPSTMVSKSVNIPTAQPPQDKPQVVTQIVAQIPAPPEITRPNNPPTPPPQVIPPTKLPPPSELLKPSPQESPPALEVPNVPGTITVQKFDVVGSTVFSAEELEQVTKPFTQRPITFAELLQVRTAITKLYIDRGFITSGAFIPPQTIDVGVVKVQILEGALEAIDVKGLQRLNPDYVRSRLAIATNKPLNRDRLIEALQLLQLNPLIANISAELSTGTKPGQNLLAVKVTEAKTFHGGLTIDNRRSPSVGTMRRQAQIREDNLFGQGDGITFAYTNTDGSNAYDFSYTYPINPQNGTLSFTYSNSNSRAIEPPFDTLDILANSHSYELTLRQPLVLRPTEEFAIGITASHRTSETSLLSTPFPLSPGADESGRTNVSALRFFQEYIQRSSKDVLALRSQFSVGVSPFALTVTDTPVDNSFFAVWRGQGQYVNLLAPDTLLLLRADIQLADRALVPLEQLGIGGQDTVRGYRQDLLLSDNGLIASAELRLPVLRVPEINGVLQFAPFFDFGTGWNSSGRKDPSPGAIAGLGFGLRWQQGDSLIIRFDYGIPLSSSGTSARTWQENGLYFSLLWNAF
jgi:hemolysin activation/secretion protein